MMSLRVSNPRVQLQEDGYIYTNGTVCCTCISISNLPTRLHLLVQSTYRISRPVRRAFSPEKCDLNSTCVLCAEGKYYFQTYNIRTTSIQHVYRGMILVAVTMIFWVSVMNKYIMVDNFGM
jgi:hypothetical protein